MAVRVLIIDDSVVVRDILRRHLECIGCEIVAEAENTQQALLLFRTVSPALVTLDFAVPQTGGISGLALFRTMRAEQPRVQILVESALAAPEIRKTLLAEGAIDYIAKPFDPQNFERVCACLIELFPELRKFNQDIAYARAQGSRRA
jgi:two-component system, chemotaxis family, chemotaxis protein CheY